MQACAIVFHSQLTIFFRFIAANFASLTWTIKFTTPLRVDHRIPGFSFAQQIPVQSIPCVLRRWFYSFPYGGDGQLPLCVSPQHGVESASDGFYFLCRQIEADILYNKGELEIAFLRSRTIRQFLASRTKMAVIMFLIETNSVFFMRSSFEFGATLFSQIRILD